MDRRFPGAEHREIVSADHARNCDQLATARAEEMVMMRLLQLEAGAPVFELDFAGRATGNELFSGAKDRRKIGLHAAHGQPGLKVFKVQA
jgi:hypothetical protein